MKDVMNHKPDIPHGFREQCLSDPRFTNFLNNLNSAYMNSNLQDPQYYDCYNEMHLNNQETPIYQDSPVSLLFQVPMEDEEWLYQMYRIYLERKAVELQCAYEQQKSVVDRMCIEGC